MAEEKKISFSADGSRLSSFMKRLQDDSKALFNDLVNEAQKQTKEGREQLKIVEEQIRKLKERNKLEHDANKIILERQRASGIIDEKEYAARAFQLKDDSAVNNLQISLLQQMLGELKEKNKDEEQDKRPNAVGTQVFGGILSAELVKAIMSGVGRMGRASNEFDLISEIPGIGGFAVPLQRSWMLREQLFGARGRIRGLTGGQAVSRGLHAFGLDSIETAGVEEGIIRAMGEATTGGQVKNVAAMARAFSVDNGIINQFLGMRRMGADVNEQQLMDLIKEGINRSKFGDAISGVTNLMTIMGQNQLSPTVVDAFQKISEFNRIGGPFAAGDPRSMGLIGGIQQQLADPSNEFSQALSFSVLRRQNPNMGLLDLMIQRQKGGTLQLRGELEDIGAMGGSEDFKILQVAQRFGLTGNLDAARLLFRNREKIAAGGELKNALSDSELQRLFGEAAAVTPTIEKHTAAVTDAFIDHWSKGVLKLAEFFGERMSEEIENIAAQLGEAVGRALASEENKELAGMGASYAARGALHAFIPFFNGDSKNGYFQK